MFKMIWKLAVCWSVLNFFNGTLQAENAVFDEVPKKYTLSVCAIFKNDARYLKEWIEYHRLVGVDHFYLYNDVSTDRYKAVLRPYIQEGIVTFVNIPNFMGNQKEEREFVWPLTAQLFAYENAARIRGVETKWLIFLNVDEFIVPSTDNNIKKILEKYEDCPGVNLVSEYYDASKWDILPRRKLVIESVELTHAPQQSILRQVTKTIFKPSRVKSFLWPPYQCNFKKGETVPIVGKWELQINRYINRYNDYWQFRGSKVKLDIDNRHLSEEEKIYYLQAGYEIEDRERSIYRFLPELTRKLEKVL